MICKEDLVGGPGLDRQLLPGHSIRFTDGTLSFDRSAFEQPDSQLATIYRFYETALGHAPDPVGENFWNSALNHGQDLSQLASDFLNSAEYQAANQNLSNADYVTRLYQNGLGRAPEPAGLAFWTGFLADGGSRASELEQFIDSAEGIAHNTAVASAGVFTATT